MKLPVLSILPLVVCSLGTEAQTATSASPLTGRVEGDIYLVMKNGDVKPAASNTVYLVPAPIARSLVDSICRRELIALRKTLIDPTAHLKESLPERQRLADSAYDQWRSVRSRDPSIGVPSPGAQQLQITFNATKDSLARLDAEWRALPAKVRALSERILPLAFIEASTASPTGMRAHFAFESVRPGTYFLYARISLFETVYFWLTGAQVLPAATTKRDLDNTIVHEGVMSCGTVDLQT